MKFNSTVRVQTHFANKYLKQVCKHWEHSLPVAFDEEHGRITFAKNARGANWPTDAQVTLQANDAELICTISASATGQRDALKSALERHIDRYAFREQPLVYQWIDE